MSNLFPYGYIVSEVRMLFLQLLKPSLPACVQSGEAVFFQRPASLWQNTRAGQIPLNELPRSKLRGMRPIAIKIISLMRYRLILPYFLLLILLGFAHAQNRDSIATLVSHSVVSDSTVKTADSPGAGRVSDTTKTIASQKTDSLFVAASKPLSASQNQPQKLKLLKRKYNSRQQVLLATGMMIFVIGIMTMAQQWNPR